MCEWTGMQKQYISASCGIFALSCQEKSLLKTFSVLSDVTAHISAGFEGGQGGCGGDSSSSRTLAIIPVVN